MAAKNLVSTQDQLWSYDTMEELTAHVATMGVQGWSLIYANHLSLRARFRRVNPIG